MQGGNMHSGKRILFAAMLGLAAHTAAAQEKVLTIVLPDAIDNLDPCRMARNDVGRIIKQNVIETLSAINPADGKLVPRLATSWEEKDQDTWRFHLRENVKFHDGSDFNADAVVKAVAR